MFNNPPCSIIPECINQWGTKRLDVGRGGEKEDNRGANHKLSRKSRKRKETTESRGRTAQDAFLSPAWANPTPLVQDVHPDRALGPGVGALAPLWGNPLLPNSRAAEGPGTYGGRARDSPGCTRRLHHVWRLSHDSGLIWKLSHVRARGDQWVIITTPEGPAEHISRVDPSHRQCIMAGCWIRVLYNIAGMERRHGAVYVIRTFV